MAELTKEDLGWIFEVCVLNFEGKSLTEIMCMIQTRHILIGKEVLELIKTKWQN